MTTLFNNVEAFKTAAMNPFGLDFEVHDKKIYIPIGSALNCLGYNDYLERVIGIARVALGLLVLVTGNNLKEKAIAACHILRGILEMGGSFERELLILDLFFTIYNIGNKFIGNKKPVPEAVVIGQR